MSNMSKMSKMEMPKLPYQLMKNPTQAQLLAMVTLSQKKLDDYAFLIRSNAMDGEYREELDKLKPILPQALLPLYIKELSEGGEFDMYVNAEQTQLDRIKKPIQ